MPDSNPLVQSQAKHETIVPLNKIESTYDEYFHELTKLQEDDIIVRSNCKFCTHPARAEAELKFEKSGHYASVERFFEDWSKTHPDDPVMNPMNIRNHILNHYLQQQKRIWLREYSERLLSIMNKRISDDQRLDMLKHQFEMKLHEIASDPTIPPLKAADAMAKMGKVVVDITLTIAKLRGEIQTVQVVMEKFSDAWERLILRQQDPQMRRALVQSLEFFQSDLEGLPIVEEADG